MEEKDNIIIPFRLDNIETLEWAVFLENYSKNEDKTVIDYNFSFNVNPESKSVACILKISLFQNNKVFLVLSVIFIFKIEKEAWSKMISNDLITVPEGLKEHFLVLSIGTIRGIIFEKTGYKKVGIDKFILPTQDIRDKTGGDLVFDLSI